MGVFKLQDEKEIEHRVPFTKEMKKTHKLLFPNMIEIHFDMLQKVFESFGYEVELLKDTDQKLVDEGLKYVHNDTCYPALLTIGQMIHALKSGNYDLDKVALMMSQTGGGCRASNYIHLLRKALIKAGMGQIPVVSVNLSGLETDSGFKVTLPMLRRAVAAMVYGDILMLLKNQVKPYEANKGETEALVKKWTKSICNDFDKGKSFSLREAKPIFKDIVKDFEKIETIKLKKTKVGIVGEIYVKYSPLANNELEKFLEEQNCEVMVPGILGFLLFKIDNRVEDIDLYGGSKIKKKVIKTLLNYLTSFETELISAVKDSKFTAPASYEHLKSLAKPYIGRGCKMGEGWLLTAEMLELIEQGYENIVCAQPFGCLPNHVVGKGMIRKIRETHEFANIVPIDYDPGATKVNQENRIKLMLSVAK